MKLVVLVLVLVFGVFVSGALGDDWDSFDGVDDSNSSGSSIRVDIETNVSDMGVSEEGVGEWSYTLDFYVALGVGGVGLLIVIIFVYFFLKKPKNRWKKGS